MKTLDFGSCALIMHSDTPFAWRLVKSEAVPAADVDDSFLNPRSLIRGHRRRPVCSVSSPAMMSPV